MTEAKFPPRDGELGQGHSRAAVAGACRRRVSQTLPQGGLRFAFRMPREASLTRSEWPAPALPVSPLQRTFFCTLCKRRSSRGHVTPCNPATARSHSQVRGGEEMTPWNSVTCARAPPPFG